MELHIVFQIDDEDKDKVTDSLTVLGFFFNNENEFIKKLDIDNNKDGNEFKLNLLTLKDQLDNTTNKKYRSYMGSLTTPNCDEIVNWFVFDNVFNIDKNQKKILNQFFYDKDNDPNAKGNFRKVQALNDRVVTTGSLDNCSFYGVYKNLAAVFFLVFFL